jgi:hypothetical protein
LEDVLRSHHLGFSRRPLPRSATFVAIVDFFFDFIAELGVGVFLFGRHDDRSFDVSMNWYTR